MVSLWGPGTSRWGTEASKVSTALPQHTVLPLRRASAQLEWVYIFKMTFLLRI